MNKITIILLLLPFLSFSQADFFTKKNIFTEADTLRGQLSPARICYDVKHYTLDIMVDPDKKYIGGYVDMTIEAVEEFLTLQVDLFANMKMEKVIRMDTGDELETRRRFNAIFINMGERVIKGEMQTIRMYYSGKPTIAQRAPWDGGFIFSKDEKGRDWIGVACEGDGASLWWPNKDHLSDEPDSMNINISVPNELTCVSNGQLVGTEELEDDYRKYKWKVTYPINNYNVTLNIAHYTHFQEKYTAADGEKLDLDYYVLDYNLEKAKKQFEQVKPTLSCFEYYFGKYPFWNDGYALVETPYLGMEHQGAIAYGNQYMRGYLGGMIPNDMNFDYIIVHETGHEWFGNSVSCNDHAEMWLHESFTTYMEALFVECTMGYEDAMRYLKHQKMNVQNQEPIIGPKDVNWTKWKSSDHYYKGALMLNTLRHAINNDELWFKLIKDFHQKNKIKNIDSNAFFDLVEAETGTDFMPFFQQYLLYPELPKFLYSLKKKKGKFILKYQWDADIKNFNMPIGVEVKGKKIMLKPTTKKQKVVIEMEEKSDFKVLIDLFFIELIKC
jgi:aminopeptidase N